MFFLRISLPFVIVRLTQFNSEDSLCWGCAQLTLLLASCRTNQIAEFFSSKSIALNCITHDRGILWKTGRHGNIKLIFHATKSITKVFFNVMKLGVFVHLLKKKILQGKQYYTQKQSLEFVISLYKGWFRTITENNSDIKINLILLYIFFFFVIL